MLHRILEFTLFAQFDGDLVFGKGIVPGDGQRVIKYGHVVLPIGCLSKADNGAGAQRYQSAGTQHLRIKAYGRDQGAGTPNNTDENANQRDIGIPVGHRLAPHLNEADYRH